MRRQFLIVCLMCFALAASATRAKTHRMSDGSVLTFRRSAAVHRSFSQASMSWNPQKTYRVPVVLMSFADRDFTCENPQQFYHRMFNEGGYNLGVGPGCIADYFRDQSNGMFNIEFDVVGPIKLTSNQKTKGDTNFGMSQIRNAIKSADTQLNYADYDWSGNKRVNVVIIVYAGLGGNEVVAAANDCIWPNTFELNLTLDNVTIECYSASPELWSNGSYCGIGTICHEFCHVLGLPDFYPTESDEFSVLDEWDLMDGGNYANDGWCPPNLSIHEREFLGWQQPETLTGTKAITRMKSFDSGGQCYKIVNDAYSSEYYLLENRQWEGWDLMLPNHGLLITHVDFKKNMWLGNYVNNDPSHHRLEFFHADNFDYNYYERLLGNKDPYGADGRSLCLQNTSYPYVDANGVCHDALTDTSVPAAKLFNENAKGKLLMGKSVTNIREEGGLISFLFSDGIKIPGDANGDGLVNAKDIMEVMNYIQGRPSASFVFLAADVNEDGLVNVADILLIVNSIDK